VTALELAEDTGDLWILMPNGLDVLRAPAP